MGVSLTPSLASDQRKPADIPLAFVNGLLDKLDKALLISERGGRLILANSRARQYLELLGHKEYTQLDLFRDLLRKDPKEIFGTIENRAQDLEVEITRGENKMRARVQWMAEPDWLVVRFDFQTGVSPEQIPGTQLTVQELLQEREITYRNLLAAYLKLQEVNRQKTLFLASAAHELKTPLAVIKGYYDLLLTGSLGRLTEKQRDILEESKESSERLVRLVSMFLNYSTLESGKLVLQLRDNDLRDCLDELAKRWSEAFQRKGVKLETSLDPSISTFRFDYQKVQQTAANLLDNALKHTPSGGVVMLKAAPPSRGAPALPPPAAKQRGGERD